MLGVGGWVAFYSDCGVQHAFCGPSCQALAGEVGMSNQLDEVSRALFNGFLPHIWRKLAPDTLKTLGNWMIHFKSRFLQYTSWVSVKRRSRSRGAWQEPKDPTTDLLSLLTYCRSKRESPTSCGCQGCTSPSRTSPRSCKRLAGRTAGPWIAPPCTPK